MTDMENNWDVIIIGAGIAGINFAYRIQTMTPNLSYTILEARHDIGGTWSLFKYPGVRSDSDIFTYCFPWRPWKENAAVVKGEQILNYINESAAAYGIDQKMQFRHRVNGANWSSDSQCWTLNVDGDGKPKTYRAKFVLYCTGIYNHEEGISASIPGIEDFGGQVVHPQFWPKDLDYTDKEMVVIGSGSTAVTLLPALTDKAKHVTMLQRSPGYILSIPTEDGLQKAIKSYLPESWHYPLIRAKYVMQSLMVVTVCSYFPTTMRNLFRKMTAAQLPPSLALDPHFNPSYNPFEQRICMVQDGDFFAALRGGKASIQTDVIDAITKDTIKLKSGHELHPDIIVTATGLKVIFFGGVPITVDNAPYDPAEKFMWKNCMLQDLPNTVHVIPYINAAYTPAVDSTSQLVCRILKQMGKEGQAVAVPRLSDEAAGKMKLLTTFNISSTWVKVAADVIPKTGDAPQWRPRTTYLRELWTAWYGDIRTGMQYVKPAV